MHVFVCIVYMQYISSMWLFLVFFFVFCSMVALCAASLRPLFGIDCIPTYGQPKRNKRYTTCILNIYWTASQCKTNVAKAKTRNVNSTRYIFGVHAIVHCIRSKAKMSVLYVCVCVCFFFSFSLLYVFFLFLNETLFKSLYTDTKRFIWNKLCIGSALKRWSFSSIIECVEWYVCRLVHLHLYKPFTCISGSACMRCWVVGVDLRSLFEINRFEWKNI